MTAPALAPLSPPARAPRDAPPVAGPIASYLHLLRWQYLRRRGLLVLLVVMQLLLGLGVIYGFTFLVPVVTPQVALYFATGAPTLSLVLIGLSVVPQETAQSRLDGRFDYLAALPLPRLASMLADVTFWLLVQLPGSALTLVVAVARFHLHVHLSLLLVPAVLLVALTTASIGYAMAVSVPPAASGQIGSVLSVLILLFSPITFPLSRLPGTLRQVHEVLPLTYMADLIRGTLTGRYDARPALAFLVVGLWCAAGLGVSLAAARRRP